MLSQTSIICSAVKDIILIILGASVSNEMNWEGHIWSTLSVPQLQIQRNAVQNISGYTGHLVSGIKWILSNVN